MSFKHRFTWLILLVMLVGAYAVIETHLRDVYESGYSSETLHVLPDRRIAPVLSLGFQNLWADLLLLHSQVYAHEHRGDLTLVKIEYFKDLFDLILTLDPHYTLAAITGHFVLSSFGGTMGVVEANDLLYKAWKRNPDKYKLPMYMGFNYYIHGDAPNEVAKWFRVALENPEAPKRLIWIVDLMLNTKLGDSKNDRIQQQAMCNMCEEAEDPLQIQHFCGRCKLYGFIVELNNAARRYRGEHGKALNSPQDLVSAGYLSELPECPEGGRWYLREDGVIDSTANKDILSDVDER